MNNDIYNCFVRLRRLVYKPKNVIDIGAHNGQFTYFLISQGFNPNKVLMIEALEEKESELKQLSDKFSEVEYVISFLGKEEGQTDFYVIPSDLEGKFNKTGSSKFKELTDVPMEPRKVPVKTLDSIVNDVYDFIKIDVQGAELEVFEGAKETLKSVDFILSEVSLVEYNEGAPLAAEVINKLDELGFVLFDIIPQTRTNNILMQFDALFVRKDSEYRPRPPFGIG